PRPTVERRIFRMSSSSSSVTSSATRGGGDLRRWERAVFVVHYSERGFLAFGLDRLTEGQQLGEELGVVEFTPVAFAGTKRRHGQAANRVHR
ncbi:MAG: hypothetical protein K2V38_00415, partial [Gemmataceae bacterium]|nr:hypothetical protein [Gemmataceae bacterium]